MTMTKALVVDVIIPEKDYDSVFIQVFGINKRSLLAEIAMKRYDDGYCFLSSNGECIYGDFPRTKEKLKEYDEIIYLSQIFNDYNIGSM